MSDGQTWGEWVATGPRRAGGTADVFQAQRGEQLAAIKWARDPDKAARQLTRERDALLQIAAHDPASAQWVVAVLDHGTRDGRPWVALPWFGHTLRSFAAAAPTTLARLRACEAATNALFRMHGSSAAIGSPRLHRDVKPDNFLVEGGAVVLADLGTTRADSLADVVTPTVVYTPRYAPVEQTLSLSRPPDPSVDSYALAVTIYTCLTGTEPDSKGAFVPYTPAGARLLDAQSRRDPDPELEGLRRRPLAELVRLDEMSTLASTDENRLAHRLADDLGEAPGRAVAEVLVPALRAALEPDPDRREGDLRRLAAALESARRLLGDDALVASSRGPRADPGGPAPPPGTATGRPAPPDPEPFRLPERVEEDDPVARYTLVMIGLSLVTLIVVLALSSP